MASARVRPTRTSRGRRRSDTARAIDELILDAGLEVLAERGPDGLGLTEVARRAGFTYGAAYARYENARELLVDLWGARLRAEVERLLRGVAALRSDPGDHAAAALVFGPPAPMRLAAIGTLIASGRLDELAEVIPADLRRLLDETGLAGDDLALGLLAVAIGSAVYASVNGPLELERVHLVAGLRAAAALGPGPGKLRVAAAPPITFATGDPWRDAVFAATYDVVARSGFANVTLRRIARRSGYDPTSLYSRYAGLADLLTDVMRQASGSENSPERIGRLMASEESIAAHCASWNLAGSVTRRRFVLEVHLVTLHDRSFLGDLAEEDAEADRATARRIFPALPEEEGLARVRLWVSLGVGVLLLTDLGLVAGVDWRPLARVVRGA